MQIILRSINHGETLIELAQGLGGALRLIGKALSHAVTHCIQAFIKRALHMHLIALGLIRELAQHAVQLGHAIFHLGFEGLGFQTLSFTATLSAPGEDSDHKQQHEQCRRADFDDVDEAEAIRANLNDGGIEKHRHRLSDSRRSLKWARPGHQLGDAGL